MKQEKIVAFDVNLFQMSQEYPDKAVKKVKELLHEISVYNHLFLFSNNSFALASEMVKEWELSLGYLIVNSGACIYDIAAQKKIYENFLDNYISKFIVRISFIKNLSFIVHTSSDISFVFGANYLNSSKYRGINYQLKIISAKCTQLKSWFEIEEMFDNYSIYSIEVFFDETEPNLRKCKMTEFLEVLSDHGMQFANFITEFTVYFFAKNNFKSKSIQKVLQLPESLVHSNLVYFSLTSPDRAIASKAFFWLSDEKFYEEIEEEFEESQVIYLDSDPKIWVDWWRQHQYMWQDNPTDFGGITKRIKTIDWSKTKNRGEGFKNNCFELNIQSGVLSSKVWNEDKKRWRWGGGSSEDKSMSRVLFLWPEQVESFQLKSQKFTY